MRQGRADTNTPKHTKKVHAQKQSQAQRSIETEEGGERERDIH